MIQTMLRYDAAPYNEFRAPETCDPASHPHPPSLYRVR